MVAPGPRTGIELLADTGLAAYVLPEVPKLKLETDEHHRHKDVYEHHLPCSTGRRSLRNGMACPPILWPARRAAARHRQAEDPDAAAGRTGGLPPSRDHRCCDGPGAASGAALPRSSATTWPGWSNCTCGFTDTVRASGPTQRSAGMCGTRVRCCHGCMCSPARTCTPGTTRGRPGWRARTTRSSSASPGSRRKKSSPWIRPDLDGNEIMRVLGLRPGPAVGEACRFLLDLRMEHGPLGRERAMAEFAAGHANTASHRQPPAHALDP